ncbi:MAG: glycosyl hydrolase family 28 protein [Pseudomonadota bacterium]
MRYRAAGLGLIAALSLVSLPPPATGTSPEAFADRSIAQSLQPPPGALVSDDFTLTVNGEQVFVEGRRRISFGRFFFAGRVQVTVELPGPADSFTLSPERYQLAATRAGTTLQFELDRPVNLIVHRKGLSEEDFILGRRLLIFADALPGASQEVAANLTSVDLGLDSTGLEDVTIPLQQAIDDLSSSGGGVLAMEAGLYQIRSLLLADDVTLRLGDGARLLGADTPSTEDALVKFLDVDNAHLAGPGSIDANGLFLKDQFGKSSSAIRADRATNSSVRDVLVLNPSAFSTWIRDSDGILIYNTRLIDFANRDLGSNAGEDGIDPDASRNVTVEHSLIYAGDDAVAIKGISPTFPLIDNIAFVNNVIFNSALGAGIGIGSQLEATRFGRILFENNDVVAARFGFDISMRETTSLPGDDPRIERVLFRNTHFGESRGSAVFRSTARRQASFANVVVQHATFDQNRDGNLPRLETYDSAAIENWVFDNVQLADGPLDGPDRFAVLGGGVAALSFATSELKEVNINTLRHFLPDSVSVAPFQLTRSGDTAEALIVTVRADGAVAGPAPTFTTVTFEQGRSIAEVVISVAMDPEGPAVQPVLATVVSDFDNPFSAGPRFHAMTALDRRPLLSDGFERTTDP